MPTTSRAGGRGADFFDEKTQMQLMKNFFSTIRAATAAAAALFFLSGLSARAGLTMQLQLFREGHYYAINPNLVTNDTPPNVPFGDYLLVSPGYETNGSAVTLLFEYDTNGFNQISRGGSGGFSVFDAPDFANSFIQNVTNGQWAIFETNDLTTNAYTFTISGNINSNDVPEVDITYPTNGATDIPNQPTLTWEGPTNYSDLIVYWPNNGDDLPVTQTNFELDLPNGPSTATVDYYDYSDTNLVSSIPLDSASNAIGGWASTYQVWLYANTQFTVGITPNSFLLDSPLLVPRWNHAAFLLPNGLVLIAGGETFNDGMHGLFQGTNEAELYDPNTHSSTLTTPMDDSQFSAASVLLTNGDAFVIGGRDENGNIKSLAEFYDPITQEWTDTYMNDSRANFPATLLPNGQVLVVGGYNGSEDTNAEIYDPVAQMWSYAAPPGLGTDSSTLTLLNNGLVLMAGGSGAGTNAELYDWRTDSWTPTGPLQEARSAQVATLLPNGQVLVVGGSYDNSAEIYDPNAGVWTLAAPMNEGRAFPTATLLPNGQVLVVGGNPGDTTAEVYDPATNVWIETGPLNVGRFNSTATLVADGQVVVAGGNAGTLGYYNGPALAAVETFNQIFTQMGALPLGVALGATNLVWSYMGDAGWFGETNVTFDGEPAAQSGPIGAGQSSTLLTVFSSLASISFVWQTADPSDNAFHLVFVIDGQTNAQLNGNQPWTREGPFGMGPGTHTLQWIASVDASAGPDASTNDAGFVSDVVFNQTNYVNVSASPSVGVAPLTVYFTSPSTDANGNAMTSWLWTFGDGASASQQNPVHIYTTAGAYEPSLAAQNASGPINVYGLSGVDVTNAGLTVTARPMSGLAPLAVQFTSPGRDSAGNTVISWNWNFGDGSTSTEQNPSHTYANKGDYSPTLVAHSDYTGEPQLNVSGPGAITVFNPPTNTQLATFIYSNFANCTNIQFNGSATNLTTSDGPVLELTTSGSYEAGSAFLARPVTFGPTVGFSTYFAFRMHNPGGTYPADGLTFTIQNDHPTDLGNPGGQLGYSGIPNSVSVSFDTYDNGTTYGNPGAPSPNYIAINTNGTLNDNYFANITNAQMNDGNIWYVWIDYEGVSQDFEVRLSETPVRPLAPTLDATINVPALLGSANAYVGFTGGTGGGWEQHDILNWRFMALPTTRIMGTLNLTNTPPGFTMTNGMVLMEYLWDMDGITITNYVWVPVSITGTVVQSPPADLPPNPLDNQQANNGNPGPYPVEDVANMMAACFVYYSSASPEGGVLLSSYNNGSGYPSLLQNASFDTVLPPGYSEADFVSAINNQTQANPSPNVPPAGIVNQLNTADVQVWMPTDFDGNFNAWNTTFSLGANVGTMSVQQQVLNSPGMPLQILSPRTDGTNFMFDFVTVLNQSYTVLAKINLATTNWISYTNVIGGGYMQKITVPLIDGKQNYFLLRSP
jgi:PKD repeat protein